MVHESTWRELTDRSGEEQDNIVVNASSWGQTIKMVGAPAQSPLQFAGLTIADPEIFFTPNGKFDPIFMGERIDAIMGNAPFYDYAVVLDLRGKQFGIAPGT